MATKSSPKLSRRDEKFSGRFLYYGGAAGSVPFTWESQPGTPKHTFSDDSLPPLTPPPSYKFSPNNNYKQNSLQKKNSKFFNYSIFPRVHSRKINATTSFSQSSSSYSLPSTPFNVRKGGSGSVDIRFGVFEEYEDDGRRVRNNNYSTSLCFGPAGKGSSSCRKQPSNSSSSNKVYLYPLKTVKKMVLSIVGHGSSTKA